MKEGYVKIRKLLSLSFVFMLISSVFMVANQPTIYVLAANGTEVKVINPSSGDGNFTFYTDTTSIGDTFFANISVFNVTGLNGWQANITWNPAYLECLDMTLPSDHVFAGQSHFPVAQDINNIQGYALWAVALGIGATPVNVSEGRLCQLEFNITAAPPVAGMLTCPLHIVTAGEASFFTKLEPSLSFTTVDGIYEYSYPPLPEPVLKVEPAENSVMHLGETFEINVTMNNLVVDWRAIGVEFKLRYHPDVLELVDVTEGPFMKQFVTPPNTADNGTIFVWYDEHAGIGADYFVVGIVLWPNITGTPSWTVFAEGNGTIATITLKAIKLPSSVTLELFDTKIV
ncbi:MAG: hypothetical protein JSV51_06905, partial [Candidatus Bathyarchaeota archaeon]